jgi:ABC-type transport system involved in cytochrome c biogenesis permease subunit
VRTLRRVKRFLLRLFGIRPTQMANDLDVLRRGIGVFAAFVFGLAAILAGVWAVVAVVHYFWQHS